MELKPGEMICTIAEYKWMAAIENAARDFISAPHDSAGMKDESALRDACNSPPSNQED